MKLFPLLCALLPNPLKILIYRKIFGWTIGSNVKIGYSYIYAKQVLLIDRIHIGHFNIIRNLNTLQIGSDTHIANFNSIFGAPYDNWEAKLHIGQGVKIMSHHFIDVGGKIDIGDRTVLGGRSTQLWGHTSGYDPFGNLTQTPLNIHIGQDVYIGAKSALIGCGIPDRTIIGAGSVVTKHFDPEPSPLLIAGNPATIKKRYHFRPPPDPNPPCYQTDPNPQYKQ
jgi:acetyltransferase-like isoleucine patch superfamily enzyme